MKLFLRKLSLSVLAALREPPLSTVSTSRFRFHLFWISISIIHSLTYILCHELTILFVRSL